MYSMKDVARLAGVSVSTVSRVLNNSNFPIDKNTKRTVEEAIKSLDFKPNLLAKGLKMRIDKSIGLVVPRINHPTFARLISQIEESLVESGYSLKLGNTRGDPECEDSFINNLIRRNVSGIIFSRVSDESRILGIIKEQNIPTLVIDRAIKNEEIP